MKSALNNIMISLIFALGGVIALLFNLMGNQDWILNWVGVLLAYLSLAILIDLSNKTVYYKIFPKILYRTLFISFNTAVLGIVVGITYQLLGKWNVTIMMYYWLIILFLHLITIITLVVLIFLNLNNQKNSFLYKFIILLNIFLTLGPVLYPLVLTIIGNGMSSSAGN
ncbi:MULTISPECIES: DUF3902 family protein [Bacillus]|uniref:DUF3902 family protein n=1 Tax=Bacillus thuringiensis serovar mexicanensis TaxID=180868 RepID=A0A242WA67_BACTU|nr:MULTISPECIES: DUF3902 family protein [Bacillus cereus group]EEM56585.1 hypothetical protein bthur0007_56050 [Bacillus thuringiensis serovar monterrey BGSC 4AJ1]KMP32396.1 hypothetical protein TU52_18580 [Bacillus cereus]MEB9672437.1 DUF3902 family protein [Bacillus anthracis]OTW50486.1 hypothetical protein BK699_10785 [Bacillus thuringiensis serovar mexicanensis]OTX06195.1 hypothetical protein BK705_11055 [Bacillus thuringiensis serovar monterrey]